MVVFTSILWVLRDKNLNLNIITFFYAQAERGNVSAYVRIHLELQAWLDPGARECPPPPSPHLSQFICPLVHVFLLQTSSLARLLPSGTKSHQHHPRNHIIEPLSDSQISAKFSITVAVTNQSLGDWGVVGVVERSPAGESLSAVS